MEAPKLETVPEETEAQPVSRPTNKHITSDVPKTVPATEKNPGRVASGKRLAERNRLAREAKKQAKAASATPTPDTSPEPTPATSSSSSDSSSNTYGYTLLDVGGLLVSAMGLYYQREAIMNKLGRNKAPAPTPAPKDEEFKDLPTAIHRSLLPVPKRRSGIREMD